MALFTGQSDQSIPEITKRPNILTPTISIVIFRQHPGGLKQENDYNTLTHTIVYFSTISRQRIYKFQPEKHIIAMASLSQTD